MKRYIIAIDQSTSATKAILFDEQCRVVNRITHGMCAVVSFVIED